MFISKKKRKAPAKIGHETIYPQQWEMAREALAITHKGERSPIILLQPQAGKTGVVMAACYEFIESCHARKKTFQVIVLCGLPSIALAEQTRSRLTIGVLGDGSTYQGAQLEELAKATKLLRLPNSESLRDGIIIKHNSSSLKGLDYNMDVDERLIIIDEVHFGHVKHGNIDEFLKNHGVYVSEQRHAWDNKRTRNSLIVVSATPFAHSILSDNFCKSLKDKALFETIYRNPPENYNSIEGMLRNGRIRKIEPLFIDDEPSEFLRKVETDFKATCRKKGPGLLVIRATGRQHARVMGYINQSGKIEVKEFDAGCGNIDELNDYLSRKPSKPIWVIIRGAMRAGITLGAEHYIRAWVETPSTQADVVTQSGAGRACGYGRDGEEYPIYCHISALKRVVAFYKSHEKGTTLSIPASRHSLSFESQSRGYHIRMVTLKQARKEKAEQENLLREQGETFAKGKAGLSQISTTRGNVKGDIAKRILHGSSDSGRTFGYHIDGPSRNPAFRASYEALLKAYPGCEGMVAVLDYKTERKKVVPEVVENRDHFLKQGSALKKEARTIRRQTVGRQTTRGRRPSPRRGSVERRVLQ